MDTDRSEPDGDERGSDEADVGPNGMEGWPDETDAEPDDEPPGPIESLVEEAIDEEWADQLFRSGRTNAVIAWGMVAVLVATFLESLLDFDLLSMVLTAAVVAVVVAPAVAARDPQEMLPWELLAIALLPVLVGALLGGDLGIFAVYLAIAALALVITVDLHMFTSLRVTHWFAVVLVVMTTLATAAVWSILRWNLDRLYGTSYLTTNEALMVEWIYVTLAGLAAGILFDVYFRQRGRRLRRVLRRVVRR